MIAASFPDDAAPITLAMPAIKKMTPELNAIPPPATAGREPKREGHDHDRDDRQMTRAANYTLP